jgi:phosphoglycolate phosphatase
MKYNTFIFDFDYTLVNATVGIVDSVNYALSRLDVKPKSSEDIRKTVGTTLTETLFTLTGIDNEKSVQQFISDFKFMADKVMTDNTILFDDTISILSLLKSKNYNTGIVTSKLHYRIDEVLNKYTIANLIDYIVGYEDVDTPKPSPTGLLKAINHFEIDKQNVLYIGDSLVDTNTALNATVDFAAVTTGTTTARELKQFPHIYIASSLTELFQYLNIK